MLLYFTGHYIPQLSSLIIEKNKAIEAGTNTDDSDVIVNLKGVAIGNPYTERDSNVYEGWLPAMYSIGIINPQEYQSMFEGNCSSGEVIGHCANQFWKFVNNKAGDLNVYDVNVLANVS